MLHACKKYVFLKNGTSISDGSPEDIPWRDTFSNALPLPIIENSYPWNNEKCTKCGPNAEDRCYGHYSESIEEDETWEYAQVPTISMESKFKTELLGCCHPM